MDWVMFETLSRHAIDCVISAINNYWFLLIPCYCSMIGLYVDVLYRHLKGDKND